MKQAECKLSHFSSFCLIEKKNFFSEYFKDEVTVYKNNSFADWILKNNDLTNMTQAINVKLPSLPLFKLASFFFKIKSNCQIQVHLFFHFRIVYKYCSLWFIR